MNDQPDLIWVTVGNLALTPDGTSYAPEVISLFVETEFHNDPQGYPFYSTAIEKFIDRLQIRGFTIRRAHEELAAAVQEHDSEVPEFYQHVIDPYWHADELLSILSVYINAPREGQSHLLYPPPPGELISRMGLLPYLRLALDLVEEKSQEIQYRFSQDFARRQKITAHTQLSNQVREDRQKNLRHDAPLVILTEGSSDSSILVAGASVTHPHLVGLLSFMDFSVGAEGSAANLAKLIRSFIGAGIANRVVAIADNDTAARDALDSLKREAIPDGYRILHYPALPLLTDYPTLGPQSNEPIFMDVNGKAGSLEMYLGRELLTVDGDLIPVQWTGYVDSQHSYQGSIAKQHKSRIQKSFRVKAKIAHQNPGARSNQDWDGVARIIDAIVHAFD